MSAVKLSNAVKFHERLDGLTVTVHSNNLEQTDPVVSSRYDTTTDLLAFGDPAGVCISASPTVPSGGPNNVGSGIALTGNNVRSS